MCRDADRRQFDVVMAWSVDRLGRSLQDRWASRQNCTREAAMTAFAKSWRRE